MKKKNIFALLAMLLTMSLSAVAQTEEKVDNYTVDFNDIQITEGYGEKLPNDWTPKSGWGHIVKSSFSGNYKGYSASKKTFFTSPALHVGSETVGGYYGDPGNTGDYLVTPKLQGTVTLKVAGDSYRYGITIRKAEKNADGTYALGDTIYTNGDTYSEFNGATGTLQRDAWNDVSVTVDDATQLAIAAYELNIDDFTATTAWITKEKKVALTSVKRTAPEGNSVDADADGNFNVSYDVELTNNGDFDLTAGEAQLKLVNASDTSIVYAEKPFPGMEIGEISEPQTLSATIHTDDFKAISFLILETLTGKTADGGTITPVEYVAKPVLKNGTTVLDGTSTIDFGTSQKAVSQNLTITNDGGADYVISGVTVPEGFSTTLEPQTVAAHKTITFSITKDAGQGGTYEGNVVIKSNVDDITIPVKGKTINEDLWYVDFEDNKIPANMESQRKGNEYWATTNTPYTLELPHNTYMAQITDADTLDLYSPKLVVAAGDQISFDAAKIDASGSSLDVLYSTDRKNWTLVKSISSDEGAAELFSDEAVGSWTKYYLFKTFTIDNIPAGEYYLAFRGHKVELDNINGYKLADVKSDFIIRSSDIPTTAEVNSPYKAKVTVKNNTLNTAAAGSYKVALSFDGDDNFAIADAPAIKAGNVADITITGTPHATGTKAAYIYIEADGVKVSSDTVNVVVGNESVQATVVVGNEDNAEGNSFVPYAASTTSEGEVVYTAEDLAAAGITNGTQIGGVSFSGAITTEWKASDLEITIGNSTQGEYSSDDLAERTVTDKQTLHNGEYDYTEMGSYSSWSGAATWADIMNFKLGKPFVYTGGSIVLHFNNTNVSDPWYGDVYFKNDPSFKNRAIERNTEDDDISTAVYSIQTGLPITGFNVIRTPETLSGTVTDEAGKAVEGAKITLTSGNVEYSATSDAEGKYSLSVVKTERTYDFFAVAAGYEPVAIADSVFKLQAGDNIQNVTLKAAKGLYIKSISVPASGTVNSPVAATVTVLNPLATEVSNYNVQFAIDGEDAKAADGIKTLPSLGTATYTISSTPHKAGNVNAHFNVVSADDSIQSDERTINVAEEKFTTNVQVLDSTAISTTAGPFPAYYSSETQSIYSADQVGLPANAQITKLTYRGFSKDSYSGDIDRTVNVKVWLDNTDVDPADYNYGNGYEDVAFKMSSESPLYEGTIHYTKKGSEDSTYVLLEVPIEGGFTYTGKSLRITIYQESDNTTGSINWVNNNSYQEFSRTAYSQGVDVTTRSWSRDYATPVVWIEANNSATVTGKVTTSKGDAVEGATVTVSKGDVVYTATTDENGDYSLTISHFDENEFSIIVAADKYKADTASIAATAGEALEHNVVLEESTSDGINEIAASKNAEAKGVYTISGQYLGRKANVSGLRPGIYIIDGKKVVVK